MSEDIELEFEGTQTVDYEPPPTFFGGDEEQATAESTGINGTGVGSAAPEEDPMLEDEEPTPRSAGGAGGDGGGGSLFGKRYILILIGLIGVAAIAIGAYFGATRSRARGSGGDTQAVGGDSSSSGPAMAVSTPSPDATPTSVVPDVVVPTPVPVQVIDVPPPPTPTVTDADGGGLTASPISSFIESQLGDIDSNPICNVCGEGKILTNYEADVAYAGGLATVTCFTLDQWGQQGRITSLLCLSAQPFTTDPCGCIDDPDAVPTVAPVTLDPAVRTTSPIASALEEQFLSPPNTHPPCNVCGSGNQIISTPDADIVYDGLGTATCFTMSTFGQDGRINPTSCALIPAVVSLTCGCVDPPPTASPAPTTTEIPSVAPSSSPAPTVRTMSPLSAMLTDLLGEPNEYPPCNVCGNDGNQVISIPDADILFQDVGDMTCYTLSELGQQGQIDPVTCFTTPLLTLLTCGCTDPPPTSSPAPTVTELPSGIPTSSPAPTVRTLSPVAAILAEQLGEVGDNEPCNVCGDGRTMTNFDGDVLYPDAGTVSCFTIQTWGQEGRLPSLVCLTTPLWTLSCGCTDDVTPSDDGTTLAPTASPAPSIRTISPISAILDSTFLGAVGEYAECDVCSGNEMTNLDAGVEFPGIGGITCYTYLVYGQEGRISPLVCLSSPILSIPCGCTAAPVGPEPTSSPTLSDGLTIEDGTTTSGSGSPTSSPTESSLTLSPVSFLVSTQITPVGSQPVCHVCGGDPDQVVTNPTALVSLSVLGTISCYSLDTWGKDGQLNFFVCASAQLATSACGCTVV